MSEARFDPTRAVTFDLTHGLVHVEGAPSRVLVPAEALAALARAAGPEARDAFAEAIGSSLGKRVASRLTHVRTASADAVVEHLNGELALAGLGVLGLERWGRALVLVVDQSPLGAGGDALLASVLAWALRAATGAMIAVAPIDRDATRARFFVGSPRGVSTIEAMLADGVRWGDALVRLHAEPNAQGASS